MTALWDALGIDYLLTALVVVLVPGIGVIYTVSTGLMQGARASMAAAFGCTLGIVPHLTASALGLAALLHAGAMVFQTVKILGVLYLLYLAWDLWRAPDAFALDRAEEQEGTKPRLRPFAIAIRGILINVLNPKLSIFFLAFIPQFIPADAPDAMARMAALSATFMLLTLIVFLGYGIAAAQVRSFVLSSRRIRRWVQRGFAAVFAALAIKLALTER